MTDDFENNVSADSIAKYRAVLNPPTRWPYFVFALVLVAMVCGLVAYLGTLASNAYNAKLCHDSEGVWTAKGCTPPAIEVNHYTVTLPPQNPNNDVPAPTPVVPDNPGQRL